MQIETLTAIREANVKILMERCYKFEEFDHYGEEVRIVKWYSTYNHPTTLYYGQRSVKHTFELSNGSIIIINVPSKGEARYIHSLGE